MGVQILIPDCHMTQAILETSAGDSMSKKQKVKQSAPDATKDIKKVSIKDILKDSRFQVRLKLDEGTVGRYLAVYKSGITMPPIKLAKVNGTLLLVDGWHRLAAFELLNESHTIDAEIIETTETEAFWLAAEANLQHGLPLKTSEIRQAFRAYIKAKKHRNEYGFPKSYRQIAQELGGLRHYGTIRNWMINDFPRIAAQYGPEDAPSGKGGLMDDRTRIGSFEGTARDALSTAITAFRGIAEPKSRGMVIKQAEAILDEMKSGKAWAYHDESGDY
jgi:hypothetical protein